jgi:hypothetical protein
MFMLHMLVWCNCHGMFYIYPSYVMHVLGHVSALIPLI